jgi:hypothetical protein
MFFAEKFDENFLRIITSGPGASVTQVLTKEYFGRKKLPNYWQRCNLEKNFASKIKNDYIGLVNLFNIQFTKYRTTVRKGVTMLFNYRNNKYALFVFFNC